MIPVCSPALGTREAELVADCVRTGWISSDGAYVRTFEESWAAYCGRRFGVAVSSGTAALLDACAALELGPGDEVIMPTFTIISCALAIVRRGAVPVLVDCDPRTWCMDVSAIAARLTPRTRAVMPVHMYGHPVHMEPLLALARQHSLYVIEDAAEAHGAECHGRRCGSFGDLSCFSFYANKLVTTGEGGMIVTDDERLAERARRLRDLAFEPGRRFVHEELGDNHRITNLQAALGVAQVATLEQRIDAKRRLAAAYSERLSGVSELQLPAEEPWARNVYWMYGVVVDPGTGLSAAEVAARLTERGVQTRPFFLGMHEQPALRGLGLFQSEHHPVAERLARQGLYLPSGTDLTDAQVDHVSEALQAALRS